MNTKDFIDKINRTMPSKDTSYRTSSPIVREENSKKLFILKSELEALKGAILEVGDNHSKEYKNLMNYVELANDKFDSLLTKADELNVYITERLNFVNANINKVKINGDEEYDIDYLLDNSEDPNSINYKNEVIIPKLKQIHKNSLDSLLLLGNTLINNILNLLLESTTLSPEAISSMIYKYDYYKKIDKSYVSEDFGIESMETGVNWLVKEVRNSIGDTEQGIYEVFKIDQQKYNKVKALTKGNDIIDLIAYKKGNIDVIQTTGKGYNYKRDPNTNEPIFPFINKGKNSIDTEIYEVKSSFDETIEETKNKSIIDNFDIKFNSNVEGNIIVLNELDTIYTNILNQKIMRLSDVSNVNYTKIRIDKKIKKIGNRHFIDNNNVVYVLGINSIEMLKISVNGVITPLTINNTSTEKIFVSDNGNFIIKKGGVVYRYGTDVNIVGGNTFNTTLLEPTSIDIRDVHFAYNSNGYSTFIVTTDNRLIICGRNDEYILGVTLGYNGNISSWTYIDSLSGYSYLNGIVDRVYSLNMSTFIITTNNELYACGTGNKGQLGSGTSLRNTLIKINLPFSNGIKKIIRSENNGAYTILISNSNEMYIAGSSGISLFVTGGVTSNFVKFTEGGVLNNNVKDVFFGPMSVVYITTGNSMYARGWNTYGQFGIGTKLENQPFIFIRSGLANNIIHYFYSTIIRFSPIKKRVYYSGLNVDHYNGFSAINQEAVATERVYSPTNGPDTLPQIDKLFVSKAFNTTRLYYISSGKVGKTGFVSSGIRVPNEPLERYGIEIDFPEPIVDGYVSPNGGFFALGESGSVYYSGFDEYNSLGLTDYQFGVQIPLNCTLDTNYIQNDLINLAYGDNANVDSIQYTSDSNNIIREEKI
ncbi:MAG TPA: hypothetical protein PK507_03850 [bacterium]|nr:hypothetical protein [bacterium]